MLGYSPQLWHLSYHKARFGRAEAKSGNANRWAVVGLSMNSAMQKTMPLLVLFSFIITAMLVVSCSTKNYASQIQELEQNQVIWENQHIIHYRMSVNLPYETTDYGELPMPLTVEVKENNVVLVMDSQGNVVTPEGKHESTVGYYYRNFFTISGLFSYVHEYYLEKPPDIRVSYNSTLGYPESIYINPYTEPCCQDFTIEIKNFEVLP